MSTIITFPGSSERKPAAGVVESTPVQTEFGSGRSRKAVQVDVDAHVKARKAYGKAVAWALATEAGEAEAYQIEEARQNTAMAYREMQDAARNLLICMPTDPKGLVDLLMYLESNYSTLPLEVSQGAGGARSLAFHLLKTVRLSLRHITKYGTHGPSPYS